MDEGLYVHERFSLRCASKQVRRLVIEAPGVAQTRQLSELQNPRGQERIIGDRAGIAGRGHLESAGALGLGPGGLWLLGNVLDDAPPDTRVFLRDGCPVVPMRFFEVPVLDAEIARDIGVVGAGG